MSRCSKCGDRISQSKISDMCDKCVKIPWACISCDKVLDGYLLGPGGVCWECATKNRCSICGKLSNIEICRTCDKKTLHSKKQLYLITVAVPSGFGGELLKKHLSEHLVEFSCIGGHLSFETEDLLICEWLRNRLYKFKKTIIRELVASIAINRNIKEIKLLNLRVHLVYGEYAYHEKEELIILDADDHLLQWLKNGSYEYTITGKPTEIEKRLDVDDLSPQDWLTEFSIDVRHMLVPKYLELKEFCKKSQDVSGNITKTSEWFIFRTANPVAAMNWLNDHDIRYC